MFFKTFLWAFKKNKNKFKVNYKIYLFEKKNSWNLLQIILLWLLLFNYLTDTSGKIDYLFGLLLVYQNYFQPHP